MKNGLVACLALLFICGCSAPHFVSLPPTPSSTSILVPTPTETATAGIDLSPTPTAWLPYDSNPSTAGCGDFVAVIPAQGMDKLSLEELFKRLFGVWLTHFRSPELGGTCRLEDYKVENVRVDPQIAFLAAEQHLEQVAWVEFSVQVRSEPTVWVAGNGELAAQGWVVHKNLIVGFAKNSAEITLKIIGTGP